MSSTLTDASPTAPSRSASEPGPGLPPFLAGSAHAAAAWCGFGAAALGAFVTVAIALVLWIPDSTATGTSGSTVRAGVLTFLAAQHGGIRLSGVDIGFVPLGLTVLAIALCRRSARVLWALPSVVSDLRPTRVVMLAVEQSVVYAATCAALVPFSAVGTSRVPMIGVVLGAAGVGVVGFGAAALTMTPLGALGWGRLPTTARVGARAGTIAVGAYLAAGALLAAAATALDAGRFMDLSRGLGRGVAGVPVAALDTAAAPNAVLAATSLLTGPGFAVGRNSTYSLLSSHPGPVPAFPIMAGLPAGAATPVVVLILAAATVLAAGITAGRSIHRATRTARWTRTALTGLTSAVFAGLLLALLAALAGGRMGAHELRVVGASPWQIGAAAAVEVGLVATVSALVSRLIIRQERGSTPAQARLDRDNADRSAGPGAAGGTEPATSPADAKTVDLHLVPAPATSAAPAEAAAEPLAAESAAELEAEPLAAEPLATGVATAGRPTADGPTADGPAADGPTADGPTVELPAVQDGSGPNGTRAEPPAGEAAAS